MKFYLSAIALSLLGLTYAYSANASQLVEHFATKLDSTIPTYAIIIDAGSTASRLHVFTFHHSVVDGQLALNDSLFLETKPGLSAFAKNLIDVKKSLDILLDEAKAKIPRLQWASTPMSLRATAGLRLLPENEAQAILDECKRVVASSEFKVTEDSVAIMNGTDEGIFSWITMNYLLDKFSDLEKTVAALDLGGGSNQVTFSIAPHAIPKDSPHAKNIHHVNVLGKNNSVFTESFLGMGLNAAKEKILTHPDNPRSKGSEVTSECVSPLVSKKEWNYGEKTYVISGPEDNTVRVSVGFDKCIGIIKKVVHSAISHDLPSFKEHEIYAISYYFERAEEAGLIDMTGGVVTVDSLHKLASKVCENPSDDRLDDRPFMCLDLSYIYVLLHDGFGLGNNTNIFMYRYINGHELSWALGAAFELLQNDV